MEEFEVEVGWPHVDILVFFFFFFFFFFWFLEKGFLCIALAVLERTQ